MPYNTKAIKRDINNNPVPQVFDVPGDDFAPLTGDSLGGGRFGADSITWGKTEGGVYIPVRVSADGKPQVTDTDVIERLGNIADAAVTSPGASAAAIALLKGLLKQLQGDGSGSAPVTVGSSALPAGASTAVKQDTIIGYIDGLEAALGTTGDTDTLNTVIGRLKKLVALLPTSLTASGNLKAALQEALPAGTNNIGSVNVAQASTLESRLGEVQATPTANTVLARLKSLEGYVDGLEGALGTTGDAEAVGNGSLIAVVKRLRTVLGEVQTDPTANTVLARLKSLEGYVDGVEAALGATTQAEAIGDGSIIQILKRIRTLIGQEIVTLGAAIGATGVLMAGSDGVNARAVRTKEDGTQLIELTGSNAELASVQDAQAATTVQAYNRAADAAEIGVYVESGEVRVRTDGIAATATTGIPLSEGFYEFYKVAAISVYFVENSTITVVSR